jgi:hypothetical protein
VRAGVAVGADAVGVAAFAAAHQHQRDLAGARGDDGVAPDVVERRDAPPVGHVPVS